MFRQVPLGSCLVHLSLRSRDLRLLPGQHILAAVEHPAAETDRLVRLAYQEGRGTSLELVTAAQSLRESEIQLALRDFELVKARVLAVLALASCPW